MIFQKTISQKIKKIKKIKKTKKAKINNKIKN